MSHVVDRYSSELVNETIEHEIENALDTDSVVRPSLGPGQRYAAKGAHLSRRT